MSQRSEADSIRAEFGANEWLVDELHQQYLKDKNSVDPAWWEFFQDYKATEALDVVDAAANGQVPKFAAAKPVATPPAMMPSAPSAPPIERDESAEPTTPPVATAQPATAPYAEVLATTLHQGGVVADGADEVTRLRGPAARVVTNMESSLAVPTATSVRAIPAKLLVDNRIVINNHLVRTRGGKVSFTHIIGFALIEALAEMPAMNSSFALVEDKPSILSPVHVNLGLAIDLSKPDGSRQLLVPSIKRTDAMDFAQFWAAYEDVVRRARASTI